MEDIFGSQKFHSDMLFHSEHEDFTKKFQTMANKISTTDSVAIFDFQNFLFQIV